MIFGMGDYFASHGLDFDAIYGSDWKYPGDVFHYAKVLVAMAAQARGMDEIDCPFWQQHKHQRLPGILLAGEGTWYGR